MLLQTMGSCLAMEGTVSGPENLNTRIFASLLQGRIYQMRRVVLDTDFMPQYHKLP
jgi:hypothetical protein